MVAFVTCTSQLLLHRYLSIYLHADPEAAVQQVCEACDILDEEEVLLLSAKTGLGMEQVLPSIIE